MIYIFLILIIKIIISNEAKFKEKFNENIKKLDIKQLEILINDFRNSISQNEIQYAKNLILEKRKQLDSLNNILSNLTQKIIVSPVIKWGQSKKKIYLYIKLAHRYDSPGCLDILKQNINIEKNSEFNLNIECIQAHQPINFKLNFSLRENVETEFILKKGSVGVLEITLKKKEEKIWPILPLLEESRKKYTIKVWSEIEDLHLQDMEEFYDLYDEYETNLRNSKNKEKNKNIKNESEL